MSTSGSSSAWNRPRRKAASASPWQGGVVASLPPPLPPGTLSLVPCPCCRIQRTIRLVSQSTANPGRVFYKCPNHRVTPEPCNHYYWENGEDNYVDFLVRNGYNLEEKEEGEVDGGQNSMLDVVKKMDELIVICKHVFVAIVCLIAVMLYVAIWK